MVITQIAKSQTPNNDPTWELIFEEKFDSLHVDNAKWMSNYPWNQKSYQICSGDTLRETLGYRTPNFNNCELDTIGNGKIKLVSRKESPPYSGKCWDTWVTTIDSITGDTTIKPIDTWHDFNYTTAMLYSRDKFRYGYFEIKCKLPEINGQYNGQGLGPNFWLFGANPTFYGSEIDIFEFDGKNNLHTSNVHYQINENDNHWSSRTDITLDSIINFNTFHTFSAEWEVDKINIKIDNKNRRIAEPPGELIKMPIIIDINHPLKWLTGYCIIDTTYTIFPYEYEIDYVKVWQLQQDCNTDINLCNFNINTYNFAVYKTINIGGTSCLPTVHSGENLVLRATDGITLSAGFTVELGAEFSAIPTKCQQQEHTKYINIPNEYPAPKSFYERSNN